LSRLQTELAASGDQRLCYGAFLSRTQYVHDLDQLGMTDARGLRKHHGQELASQGRRS
jgi:hypothetical protein